MRSQLTRQVFRQLIRNEPISHQGCLRRAAITRQELTSSVDRRCPPRNGTVSRSQRRTLFNFSLLPRKQQITTDPDMDPGIDKMMELAKRERMNARMPPLEDVAKALRDLFAAKSKHRQILQDNQASLALQSFRYLWKSYGQEGVDVVDMRHDFFSDRLLKQIEIIMPKSLQHTTIAHRDLVHALHEAVSGLNYRNTWYVTMAYVRILRNLGELDEAREVVLSYERSHGLSSEDGETEALELGIDAGNGAVAVAVAGGSGAPAGKEAITLLWSALMTGAARGNNEEQLNQILAESTQRGLDPESSFISSLLIEFYIRQNDLAKVTEWYTTFWRAEKRWLDGSDIGKLYRFFDYKHLPLRTLIRWCMEKEHFEFGHEIVRRILNAGSDRTNPTVSQHLPREWRDEIFIWAAGCGKGADEIGKMMDVVSASDDDTAAVSIDAINGLVEIAISKNNPYLAERYIAMGQARGIQPDARTCVLQMRYRLDIGDVDGALTTYISLQSMDLTQNNDLAVSNKLLAALCRSGRHDFDTIMNVAGDLSDRGADFEPETISSLSLVHLRRDETADVTDLLNTHAFRLSSTGRDHIRQELITFCTDSDTNVARAWDTYTILRQTFDEMTRDERTQIMLSFFRRDRPDMAVNVFTAMRAHTRSDTIPTKSTYVSAFLAIARTRDDEILSAVHNQLKLDVNIDPDTHLTNALMIALVACGRPRAALNYWADLAVSREGPSYNTIHIALRACEKSPFGDVAAQRLWARVRRSSIELDQGLWASYAAALAGCGDIALATRTLDDAVEKGEVRLDPLTVGSVFAACQNEMQQDGVETWCKERDGKVWEELVHLGSTEDEVTGLMKFNIDRRVAP